MAAITTAVIAVVGAAVSYTQQRKAAKAQARSERARQRQADIANARERRATVRNARVARASAENQAALTGVSDSSAIEGSVANIQNQLGENISFLDQNAALSEEASRANQQALAYQTRAAGYAALTQAAMSAASSYGGGSGGGSGGSGGSGS